MDTNNVNNSFTFTVNLKEVRASGMARPQPIEGYYQGSIVEAYINMERNPNRVIFKVDFVGAYQGNTKLTGLSLPDTGDFDSRPQWRALLESAGFTPAQLDSGALNVSAQALIGRQVHFYFRPKSETAEQGTSESYDKTKFLAPTHWNSGKDLFSKQTVETKAKVTVSTPKAQNLNTISTPAAPQAGLASSNMSPQDLLAMVK